jgi:hypothetical protein
MWSSIKNILIEIKECNIEAEEMHLYYSNGLSDRLDILEDLEALHVIRFYAIQAPNAQIAQLLFDIHLCICEGTLRQSFDGNEITPKEWVKLYTDMDEDIAFDMHRSETFDQSPRKGGKIFDVDELISLIDVK